MKTDKRAKARAAKRGRGSPRAWAALSDRGAVAVSHEHLVVLEDFGPLSLRVVVVAEETRDGWETWSEAEDERGRSVSLSLMEQAEAEIAALDRLQVEQGPASCPGWLP